MYKRTFDIRVRCSIIAWANLVRMKAGSQTAEFCLDLAVRRCGTNAQGGVEVTCEAYVIERLYKRVEEVEAEDEDVYATAMVSM